MAVEALRYNILNDELKTNDKIYESKGINIDIDYLLQELSEYEAYVTDINVDMWKVVEVTIYEFVENKKIPAHRLLIECYRLHDALLVALDYLDWDPNL